MAMAEEVLMMAVMVKVLVEAVAVVVEVESVAKNMSPRPNPRHPFSAYVKNHV